MAKPAYSLGRQDAAMTVFRTIASTIFVAVIAFPALAAGQATPDRNVGWVRNDIGANRPVFDIPPARDRALGAGLDQISRGIEARDEGKLHKACKHFRKAERHFRSAGSIQERAWSAQLAENTCPKT